MHRVRTHLSYCPLEDESNLSIGVAILWGHAARVGRNADAGGMRRGFAGGPAIRDQRLNRGANIDMVRLP